MRKASESSRRQRASAFARASIVLLALTPFLFAETPGSNEVIGSDFFLVAENSASESALQKQIREIASDARGKVSVACSLPKSALNCDLDPHAHPPMQSVFKLPLAIAVLHQVERGSVWISPFVFFRRIAFPTPTAHCRINIRRQASTFRCGNSFK